MKKNLIIFYITCSLIGIGSLCVFSAGCTFSKHKTSAETMPAGILAEDAPPQIEAQDSLNAEFAAYMEKLQKKVKSNWKPPKGPESRRVVVFFQVDKKGNILNPKVIKSGGEEYDKEAIKAVKKSSPLDMLPKEYKQNAVDVQFTLDYNVFGSDGKKIINEQPQQTPDAEKATE